MRRCVMYQNQSIITRNEKKHSSKHREKITVTSINSDAALHLLLELKQLKADGVLSLDEFEVKKRRLLAI